MRKRYPTLVFAAVASSAPVQLKYDFWEYFEPIRLYAPPRCSEAIVSVVGQVDETLKEGDERRKRELKGAFGLEGVVHDEDFANGRHTYPSYSARMLPFLSLIFLSYKPQSSPPS